MDKEGKELQLTVHNIKEIGHEFNDRITDDAAKRVAYTEEERIKKTWRLAQTIARHAGRKTIKEEDIRIVEQIEEEL